MIIDLLIHHPEALGTVLQKTPTWVWGLLAALVALGASQLVARTASLTRVAVMPVAMTLFSAYGLVSAFGSSGQVLGTLAAWLAAAAAVATIALALMPATPAGTQYQAASRSFQLPGSPLPLLLILGIFLTKYLVGIEMAMQPALAHDATFDLQIAALYGVFNGLFIARSARLWRMALAPQAATAASAPATA
ncbi:hypothetical protein PMI14_02313 [Acidovorax sp. CF316]|uniref:DUF6622 family protein n=1 Tax=Acidovorax sp. CF316 TaxID=1144317 RepID=UPI00026BCF60|nr:DUF6622 family protein [Acidovorax sp. CF316]EJE53054.1 hypothetical protein PMI14_02313 [Acidovorax sp. CF316]